MVDVSYSPDFERTIRKINDAAVKEAVKKQIAKIIENPEIGKPMKYERKGTREVYVSPYRLSYAFLQNEGKIVFLCIYHKDKQ